MLETITQSWEYKESTVSQDTSLTAQIDQLEKRLKDNARMDTDILSGRLATQVSLPNGVSGSVGQILDNEELLGAAIAAAGDAYDRYYDVVAKVPSHYREKMREGREAELDTHRGILARAKAGRYNGKSVVIGEFAQYFIGSYITGGHDVAEKMAEIQKQKNENVIFQR